MLDKFWALEIAVLSNEQKPFIEKLDWSPIGELLFQQNELKHKWSFCSRLKANYIVAVFKNPPQPLQELLGQDLSGVARPRLVRM